MDVLAMVGKRVGRRAGEGGRGGERGSVCHVIKPKRRRGGNFSMVDVNCTSQ